MPASTASGWPYVVPADHPINAPAEQSQALANMLESRIKLLTAVATKGSDQSGIASGGSAGFTCTLNGVKIGATLLAVISHVGTVSVASEQYIGLAGIVGATQTAPQSTRQAIPTVSQYWQQTCYGLLVATAQTVTVGYSATLSGGGATWLCSSRSQIFLIGI